MPLEEVAAAYHDETPTPASTFLHNIIDEAVVNRTEKKEFDLPASIFSRSSQGTRIYSAVGFISECELVRLTGRTSKFLGLKPVLLTLEQRGSSTQGFLISLRGLPRDEIDSIRKIEIYRDVNLSLEEAHLTPSKMVHDQHPCLLADFLSEQQIANYPAAFKASARSVPPTIEVAWINSLGLRVDLRLKVLEG